MKNYFNADFHRVMMRKSRVCLVLLLALADLVFMLNAVCSDQNVIEITNHVGKLDFLYVNGIMLANIWISFGDDIRAKSIQAALGTGIKRYQIVVTKWITLTLIAALDLIFLTVVQFVPLIFTGKLAGGFAAGQVICGQAAGILLIAIVLPLTMIVLFQTQQAVLGGLTYLYLSAGVTGGLILMAAGNRLVQKFQLWNIGCARQMSIFLTKLWIGQFDVRNFLMVVFYFAIGFWGATYVFGKKELDF